MAAPSFFVWFSVACLPGKLEIVALSTYYWFAIFIK